MSFTVGQEIADGQIVIVSIADNGDITAAFPNISLDGPGGQPFSATYNPNITAAALIAILNGLKAMLGIG